MDLEVDSSSVPEQSQQPMFDVTTSTPDQQPQQQQPDKQPIEDEPEQNICRDPLPDIVASHRSASFRAATVRTKHVHRNTLPSFPEVVQTTSNLQERRTDRKSVV